MAKPVMFLFTGSAKLLYSGMIFPEPAQAKARRFGVELKVQKSGFLRLDCWLTISSPAAAKVTCAHRIVNTLPSDIDVNFHRSRKRFVTQHGYGSNLPSPQRRIALFQAETMADLAQVENAQQPATVGRSASAPAGTNRYRVHALSLGPHPRLSVLCPGSSR